MKLFWKQFIGILAILIVMFTIFGNILLQSSFQNWLDREVDAALEEITMFQYTFMTSVEGLSEFYQSDENVIADIIKSIEENMGDNSDTVAVYNGEKKILYLRGTHQNNLLNTQYSWGRLIWRLEESQGIHYLETMSSMTIGDRVYYLERSRDLQNIYDNRELMFRQYTITMVVLILLSALFAMLLAHGFTAPIRKLSQATKAFAEGNYSSRVESKGNDEITFLMQDFNAMAGRLEENIHELNDAVRRQEEFTGAFAHELKTPLTSIIGYSEVLMSTELSEEARMTSAGYIYKDGKRLERLAYKMMELTRMSNQEIPFQNISVKFLMETVKRVTLPAMLAKKISLTIHAERGNVYGDGDLLLSLLLNIVDNARKACSEGGNIHIIGRKAENGYHLEIQDDGRGIPPEELPRITEAFYMVDKSRARKEGGAGLGMALCAKILALHHGTWQMKSEPGKGTTIGLLLPGKEQQ